MNKTSNIIESPKTSFGIKTISNKLIKDTLQEAGNAPRKRIPILFNKYDERPIRSIRCLDTDAYIRPHMHEDPDLYEILVPIYGTFKLLIFNSKGVIIDIIQLDYTMTNEEGIKAVEIPAFTYHTIICTSSQGAYLEINSLSHNPNIIDATFASWAPEENSDKSKETLDFLKNAHVGNIIK